MTLQDAFVIGLVTGGTVGVFAMSLLRGGRGDVARVEEVHQEIRNLRAAQSDLLRVLRKESGK